MCGNSARTDLYGGRSAMTVPTVTGTGTLEKISFSELFSISLGYFGPVSCGDWSTSLAEATEKSHLRYFPSRSGQDRD